MRLQVPRQVAAVPARRPAARIAAAVVPRSARRHVGDPALEYEVNVHGRHVDVTPDIEEYVKDRLSGALHKFRTGQYVEAAGGVRDVDVRLMNSQADIRVHPKLLNKASADTYLRMGELHAEGSGDSALASFESALSNLESKLKAWRNPEPRKKSFKFIGGSLGSKQDGTGRRK